MARRARLVTQRIAILSPDYRHPTGLPAVVRQLVGSLLEGGIDVTLVLPKPSDDFPTDAIARETVAAARGGLNLEWWPRDQFLESERSRMCYEIEELVSRRGIDRLLGIGVSRCGFTAAVAGRLAGVSVSAFVTHRDAFWGVMKAPHELELVASMAKHLLSTNPEVLAHLGRFYNVAGKAHLLDSRACAAALVAGDEAPEVDLPAGAYIVTTGYVNATVHLRSLLIEVQHAMNEEGASAWVHAGMIAPDSLVPLMKMITSMGLADVVTVTGSLSSTTYSSVILRAKALLCIDGERDTNLAAYEAERSGVRLRLPTLHPFPSGDAPLPKNDAYQVLAWGEFAELLRA